MKIAIVRDTAVPGLGGHGTHLAFRGLPGVDEVVLADSNREGIEERMAEVGAVRHYDDPFELFDRERPDIAVLCSRLPDDHPPLVEASIARGIHVLCEKPLCATLPEADRLVSLGDAAGVRIAVAHLARYSLLFREMKRMVEAGEIGEPLTVYGRGKEDGRGGGEDLVVLGTHILDAMRFLFGEPADVQADMRQDGHPLRPTDRLPTKEPVGPVAGDDVFARFSFANGVRGLFESRRNVFRPGSQVRMGITVAGTRGSLSIRFDEGERVLRLSRSPFPPEDAADYEVVPLVEDRTIPGAEPLVIPPGTLGYFAVNNRFAAWDLVQAIREERRPVADVRDAQRTLEMIQGIYLSTLLGQRVPFPLRDRRHPLSAYAPGVGRCD